MKKGPKEKTIKNIPLLKLLVDENFNKRMICEYFNCTLYLLNKELKNNSIKFDISRVRLSKEEMKFEEDRFYEFLQKQKLIISDENLALEMFDERFSKKLICDYFDVDVFALEHLLDKHKIKHISDRNLTYDELDLEKTRFELFISEI